MKKLLQYALIVLMSSISTLGYAQVHNYVGINLQAGEWSMLPTMSATDNNLKNSLGIGGGIGFTYELKAGHFLLNTGLNLTTGYTSFKIANAQTSLPNQIDVESDCYTYVYEQTNRKDGYTNLRAQIPVMLGGTYRRFYALAGVKVGYNALTMANVKANLTTYADYEKFDIYRDLPERQLFTNLPVKGVRNSIDEGALIKPISVDASIEIGWRLGFYTEAVGFDVPKPKTQYRIAIYADYGVLDIYKGGGPYDYINIKQPTAYVDAVDLGNGMYQYPMVDPALGKMELVDVLSVRSSTSAINKLNELQVGVKFTILFQTPEELGGTRIRRDNYFGSPAYYRSMKRHH